jgi:hypothetical protein
MSKIIHRVRDITDVITNIFILLDKKVHVFANGEHHESGEDEFVVKSVVHLFGPHITPATRRLKALTRTSPTIRNIDNAYTTASTAYVCIPTLHTDYSELNRRRFTDYGEELAQYLDSVDVGRPIAKTPLLSRVTAKSGSSTLTFDWARRPTHVELLDLIAQIDAALAPMGCRYTITTR